MRSKALIINLFLIMIILSCQDNELPKEVVLDRVTYGTDIEHTYKYLYNDAGQIVRLDFFEGTNLIDYSAYTYNKSNQILTRKYFLANANNNFEQYYFNTFKYDSNNKLSEVLTTGAREIHYKTSWSNGNITQVTRTEGSTTTYKEFEYSVEGNISRIVEYSEDGLIQYVLECKYDNYPNPYYDCNDPLDIVMGNILKICPNNLILMTQKLDFDSDVYAKSEVSYIYNDKGLPKKRIDKNIYGDTTERVTKFFYRVL